MQERRRFKRLNANLPVTLRFAGRLIPARVLNISCGGLCLDVESHEVDFDKRGRVEMVLDLSKEEMDVSLRGEITRIIGPDKIGIKFTNLYTVGHQTLERFIKGHFH